MVNDESPAEPSEPDPVLEPSADTRRRSFANAVGGHADRALRPTMSAARVGVAAAAVPIVATGIVAVIGALALYRSTPAVLVLAIGAGLAAIVVPVYAVSRVAKVTGAVSEPTVLANQARDLATRARSSTELAQLAGRARGIPRPDRAQGRVRSAFGFGRLVAGALDAAQPDPVRHDRLVPLSPARLRWVWLFTLAALWTWAVAAVVVVAEVVTFLLRLA